MIEKEGFCTSKRGNILMISVKKRAYDLIKKVVEKRGVRYKAIIESHF